MFWDFLISSLFVFVRVCHSSTRSSRWEKDCLIETELASEALLLPETEPRSVFLLDLASESTIDYDIPTV